MPELAEVEYFRKQWSPGLEDKILRVALHADKRIFRGSDPEQIVATLEQSKLVTSERKAKQMLFRFSNSTLGIHLGMTGELQVADEGFAPGKHDHLVIYQRKRALIFRDPRLFGRVRFTMGTADPDWWQKMPDELTARSFTIKRLKEILKRRERSPLKAVLLIQEYFPGLGNWMVDEILWRTGLPPGIRAGSVSDDLISVLHKQIRFVIKGALRTVGETFSDPPTGWLFHQRWTRHGVCPIHATALETATVGGRTSRWCPICQPANG